jgi:hypothetical protein
MFCYIQPTTVTATACMAASGKEYGPRVAKLKRICRAATITVPPSVYTRVSGEADVVERLRALLRKHGLSEQCGQEDIARARKQLQKQRDLEGAAAALHFRLSPACSHERPWLYCHADCFAVMWILKVQVRGAQGSQGSP